MRAIVLLAAAFAVAATVVPPIAEAQSSRRDRPSPEDKQQEDAAKRKKRNEEWGNSQAPLPQLKNAGPCPYVKTLYDAARYVEFKDDREASANVVYTGEIQGVSAGCQYKDEQPIRMAMDVLFELGKGPQASGNSKTFRYWIAVTDRNREVLAKETFSLPVNFPAGKDRIYVTERINEIVIPRAKMETSGANFEVLVGFEVTPQMADFNRQGKRFRVNAGAATAQAGTDAARQ